MIRVQVVTLAPLIWWISWGMISLHHAIAHCGHVGWQQSDCVATVNHSLLHQHDQGPLDVLHLSLSACLSYHCSHSCYPPLFNSEITWINCKAKTGWPILWWSSWTEKGERERAEYSGKTHCYVSELSEGFFFPVVFRHIRFIVFKVNCVPALADFCDCFTDSCFYGPAPLSDSQKMQMNFASEMVGLFVGMLIKICEELGQGDLQHEIFCYLISLLCWL